MSWITIIWSMSASACLTLALIHGMIWWRRPNARANLFFSLTAISTAAFAMCELAMMRASTIETMSAAFRWLHVPVWVIYVSLAGFVHLFFRGRRAWLGWVACGLRTVTLVLNFAAGESLNYRHVTGLRHVQFLCESASVAEGILNPWALLGQLSLLLLVVYVADAAFAAWRHGERRRAIVVGGSIVLFVLIGMAESVIVLLQLAHWPVTVSLFYLGIVAAMSFELSIELLNAAQLARDLHETQQHMTLAAEATNLGIWVRDLKENSIWATDQWRVLFGFTKSQPIHYDDFLQRLHADDRETIRDSLAEALRRGGRYENEYRLVLSDKTQRWIASQGTVELDASGTAVRLRGVSLDVTHRKHVEQEIQSHREQVAHLLRAASLGELSSALAHELNQPLAAILSNAQAAQRFLAQEKWDTNEIRDILGDIVADDQRASEVIRRLRTLLKKGTPRAKTLDANELLMEVFKLMSRELRAQFISVSMDLSRALPPIYGDPVQLQQVLINLILNAKDAMMPLTPGTRILTASTSDIDGSFVQICIGDSGKGVAKGSEEQIFEPYYTTKADGLGLGLSLSRSIAAAHGGRLWVEEGPAGGTMFCFTIPASAAIESKGFVS